MAGEVFRRSASLRRQRYEPSHPAPDAPDGMRGAGVLDGTWIACEEPGIAEGWLASSIELIMDSRLAADAVIGRHEHPDTEELYIVLEGEITVTGAPAADAAPFRACLASGDVHRLGPGGWHSARAGERGARILVIAAKAAA